jgi:ATP-dependent DNA helicase RecQ
LATERTRGSGPTDSDASDSDGTSESESEAPKAARKKAVRKATTKKPVARKTASGAAKKAIGTKKAATKKPRTTPTRRKATAASEPDAEDPGDVAGLELEPDTESPSEATSLDELPADLEALLASATNGDDPIDGEALDEIRRQIAKDDLSEAELLELAASLQQEEDEDLEDEVSLNSGPVFEGKVALDTAEQRREAMEKAAKRLGIPELYPEQIEVIDTILQGEDVLMVLPTGFGKSACYQIPSIIFDKPVVVISPLLALMQDQHDTMLRLGLPCIKLDGQLRGKKREKALAQIAEGGRVLVMTTPETLGSPDAAAALIAGGVSLAAVDEAHCISEWGYDFRPAYLQIGERLSSMGAPPALALTATATEKVRLAIVRFVGLRDHRVIAASPHRDNLAFDVLHASSGARLRALVRLALRVRRPGIIYCSTTRDVDEIYTVLQRFGVPSYRYHGKMSSAERRKSQEGFMQRGRRTVMIATNAFGLGIDKPDIRYVMHYQAPASLEQYVQEAGRAGRDGRRANCIMLFSSEDRMIHESLLSRSRVRPEQLYRLARALAAWAKDDKVPSVESLALSAELGSRTTGALLALLDDGGLVKWDQDSVFVIVPPEEFEGRARQLAGQFETLRTQDARRLDAVADYGLLEDCRAVFLQDYFGEDGANDCGICDRCRGGTDRPNSFWEPLAPPKGEERRRGKGRGKSNARGRGRNGRSGSGSGSGNQRRRSNKNRRRGNSGSAGNGNSQSGGNGRAAAGRDGEEARNQQQQAQQGSAENGEARRGRRRGRRRGGRGRRGRRPGNGSGNSSSSPEGGNDGSPSTPPS